MIVAERPEFGLIIPCHSGKAEIKRCLDSILDQDLESWEAIVVVNGEYKGRDKAIRQIKSYKDKRIFLIELKEGNVCVARNKGAEVSNGKYLSFFSSDFVMYPGALSKWKKEFDNRPNAGFIYSGYNLMRDGKPMEGHTFTREFDPYLLEVGNYIDGGFPMKREVWETYKWDKDIKSLNDWDFWLGAVKAGFKGEMIPDITYAAEVPKEGGLSYDSHNNWIERIKTIKTKHGIPERDICVVSLGAQPHGIKIAKLLNADFQIAPQMKPNNYKAIYLIGFYLGNGESAINHSRVFEGFNGKQIVHWIGTDVLQMLMAGYKVVYNDMKGLIDALQKRVNLTEFDKTQGELESIGLQSKVVPLPIQTNIDLLSLPKKFCVAVYVPATQTAKQIYNLELTADIIKSCPDINFLLFGGGGLEGTGANIRNVGWTDMQKVMAESSMLMRLTSHDGLPIAPIEFRLAGRDAMTTVPMKYIYFAGDGMIPKQDYARRKEGIIKLLREIKKKQKKDGVSEVKEAREYYLELTNPKKFQKTIRELVDN